MKDQIISAYLEDFTTQFGFSQLEEGNAFEYFVNYCVISKHHPDAFEPEDVAVGGQGDLGSDGIAIIVNDHLVLSESDVDHLKKELRRLDVQFVFVQAKRSPHFNATDIGTFIAGARQFFSASQPTAANDRIAELHRIKNHIFKFSVDMDRSPL